MNNYKVLKVSRPFNGEKYPYRLALKESTYNGKQELTVWVQRDFHNNNNWDGVPSGWLLEDVKNAPMLAIDFGQGWFVKPTKEAWEDILS